MKYFVSKQRKDGKYLVTHAYNNGRSFKKLYTPEKLQRIALATKQFEIEAEFIYK